VSQVTCRSCGHQNQEGSNFCSSCGRSLAPADEPTTMTFTLDGETTDDAPMALPAPGSHGKLVVTRGPNTGSEYSLEHVITTVGRHPDSDIFLDDVTVSRRHVEVERTPSRTVVRDVGSLNGTYVNQHRIDGEHPLVSSDEVQVGKFKLVYLAGEGS
jgi:hypothetical protein